MILAVGNSSDKEFEAYNLIQEAIHARGEKVVLFCQDKCLEGDSIIFRSKDRVCEHVIKIDGVEYYLSEFDSVIYMHPQIHKSLLRYKPQSHANFIERQFREIRRSLWTLMSNKKWIDDPWKIQRAEGKIFQLVSASSVGLDIPDTAITSDPGEVRKFYADHQKKIVSKIVIPAPILDHVIYTNPVTEEQMKVIDSVRMCPSIFQEEVSKSYELRITVVGDKLFTAKIDSQFDEETMTDWRKKPILNDHAVSFSSYELPDDITQKIFQFMEKMSLRFQTCSTERDALEPLLKRTSGDALAKHLNALGSHQSSRSTSSRHERLDTKQLQQARLFRAGTTTQKPMSVKCRCFFESQILP